MNKLLNIHNDSNKEFNFDLKVIAYFIVDYATSIAFHLIFLTLAILLAFYPLPIHLIVKTLLMITLVITWGVLYKNISATISKYFNRRGV